jgi:hypothetical protein
MNTAAPALEALQADFIDHLQDAPSRLAAAVAEGGRIGIERRLAIYHNAYSARLVEALQDSFGHTLMYLGDEGFEAVARGYLAAHPSAHPNLRWFGGRFAAWLAEVCADDPDIGELAALDWALRLAFDGADAPLLGLDALAALPPEAWATVRLVWHPTCQRLRLQHNTLAIWQALDQEQAPPEACALATPTELLVWRRELQPHFRSLGGFEAAALDRLLGGAGFAATCEALQAEFPELDTAPQAGALLRRWIEDGLLSGLDVPA